MTVRELWRKINAPRDHHWAMPRFSAYIEGELAPRQHGRLHDHEGICPECRRAIQSLRKLVGILPALRGAPAAGPVGERTARLVMDEIERRHRDAD